MAKNTPIGSVGTDEAGNKWRVVGHESDGTNILERADAPDKDLYGLGQTAPREYPSDIIELGKQQVQRDIPYSARAKTSFAPLDPEEQAKSYEKVLGKKTRVNPETQEVEVESEYGWVQVDPSGFDLGDIADIAPYIPEVIGSVAAETGVEAAQAAGTGGFGVVSRIPPAMTAAAAEGLGARGRMELGKRMGWHDASEEAMKKEALEAGGYAAAGSLVAPVIGPAIGLAKRGLGKLAGQGAEEVAEGLGRIDPTTDIEVPERKVVQDTPETAPEPARTLEEKGEEPTLADQPEVADETAELAVRPKWETKLVEDTVEDSQDYDDFFNLSGVPVSSQKVIQTELGDKIIDMLDDPGKYAISAGADLFEALYEAKIKTGDKYAKALRESVGGDLPVDRNLAKQRILDALAEYGVEFDEAGELVGTSVLEEHESEALRSLLTHIDDPTKTRNLNDLLNLRKRLSRKVKDTEWGDAINAARSTVADYLEDVVEDGANKAGVLDVYQNAKKEYGIDREEVGNLLDVFSRTRGKKEKAATGAVRNLAGDKSRELKTLMAEVAKRYPELSEPMEDAIAAAEAFVWERAMSKSTSTTRAGQGWIASAVDKGMDLFDVSRPDRLARHLYHRGRKARGLSYDKSLPDLTAKLRGIRGRIAKAVDPDRGRMARTQAMARETLQERQLEQRGLGPDAGKPLEAPGSWNFRDISDISGYHYDATPNEITEYLNELQARHGGDAQAMYNELEYAEDEIGNAIRQWAYDNDRMPMEGGFIETGAQREALEAPAYHGTPHKFDEFSLEKIGTGEGAQAYGWGLYFAEDPKIAGHYKEALSSRGLVTPDGETITDLREVFENMNVRATLDNTDGDIDAAIQRVRDIQERIPGTQGAETATRDFEKLLDYKQRGGLSRPSGHLYEVDISDEAIGRMLELEATMAEQPEAVRKALANLPEVMGWKVIQEPTIRPGRGGHGFLTYYENQNGIPVGEYIFTKEPGEEGVSILKEGMYKSDEQTGKDFYASISESLGSDKKASLALAEAGVPGLRFFDGFSRAKGEGTRNIVVFDESVITPMKRDDQPLRGLGAQRESLEGETLGLYHGSDSSFDRFDFGKPSKRYTTFSEHDVVSQGGFFSPSKEDASTYGSIVEKYNIDTGNELKDPRTIAPSSRSSEAEKAQASKAWEDILYILEPEIHDGMIDIDGGIRTVDVDPEGAWINQALGEDWLFEWNWLDNPEVVNRMRERGYDSVKVYEPEDSSGYSWFINNADLIQKAKDLEADAWPRTGVPKRSPEELARWQKDVESIADGFKKEFPQVESWTIVNEPGGPPGRYYPDNGELELNVASLADVSHAREVMLHESLGHKFFIEGLGDRLDKIIGATVKDEGHLKEVEQLMSRRGIQDERTGVLEWFAEIAQDETRKKPGAFKRFIAAVRNEFNKIHQTKLTKNDVEFLLFQSEKMAKHGKPIETNIIERGAGRGVVRGLGALSGEQEADTMYMNGMGAQEYQPQGLGAQ